MPDMGWGGLTGLQPGGGPIMPGGIMPGGGGGIRIPVPRRNKNTNVTVTSLRFLLHKKRSECIF